MKKIFLIKNSQLFQGEKYLKKNKNYFEGWYFKNTNNYNTISFIPGININNKKKKAFIQVITKDSSYFFEYNISEFKFSENPFYIRIGNNYFSESCIHIDIFDDNQNITIYGDIKYSDIQPIVTNLLYPNIMGPFSYVPFMECNHAIINMKSRVDGLITINNNRIEFKNDTGYIEKDWGCSFPKTYIWCQGNNFKDKTASFMISIANIPFKIFDFRGIICVLKVNEKEYRFATYNNTKIKKYELSNNKLNIVIKKGRYTLELTTNYNDGYKLLAPIKGTMKKNIYESVSSTINVTLRKGNKIIFNDTSSNCGLEIV